MRLYGLDLVIAVSLIAAPVAVFAQGQPDNGPAIEESGLEDDDDLLDPDLGAPSKRQVGRSNVPVPPVAEKMRIDDEAFAIGRSADQVADELKDLVRQFRADPRAANLETIRRLKEADNRLASLRTRLDVLEADLEKREGRTRARRRQRGTYGTALDLNRRARNSQSHRAGEQQFDWWHGLARKALGGLPKGLKLLGEKRVNALKSRADALAMSTERRFRGYANASVREVVESSRLGQPVFDRRLNDLFLGGNDQARTPINSASDRRRAARKGPVVNFDTREPVILLPRVRDPVTGRTRVVVDLPLGGPFTPPK